LGIGRGEPQPSHDQPQNDPLHAIPVRPQISRSEASSEP
jgi:hypothetical protein